MANQLSKRRNWSKKSRTVGAKCLEGIPLGIPNILRTFGIRIPNILGNSTLGYRKSGGDSDFL